MRLRSMDTVTGSSNTTRDRAVCYLGNRGPENEDARSSTKGGEMLGTEMGLPSLRVVLSIQDIPPFPSRGLSHFHTLPSHYFSHPLGMYPLPSLQYLSFSSFLFSMWSALGLARSQNNKWPSQRLSSFSREEPNPMHAQKKRPISFMDGKGFRKNYVLALRRGGAISSPINSSFRLVLPSLIHFWGEAHKK